VRRLMVNATALANGVIATRLGLAAAAPMGNILQARRNAGIEIELLAPIEALISTPNLHQRRTDTRNQRSIRSNVVGFSLR